MPMWKPIPFLASVLAAVGWYLLLLPAAAPLLAQEPCDCSCDAYSRMLELTEEFRAATEAGGFQAPPAEFQEMARCGGQCARQWAQCTNPDAADAFNRAPSAPGQRRPPQPEPEDPGLPKDQLMPAYLEGVWCSVYGGQEVTQYEFSSDGSYRVGFLAGQEFSFRGEDPRSLEDFLSRFDKLIELEPDTFRTEHINGRVSRENVFTRGECD